MSFDVVVITGAGSGLGAALAKKYAASGSHVCLLGRTRERLERVAAELNGRHSIFEVDVSSKTAVDKVMRQIETEVNPINLLVNNAGVGVFDVAENLCEEDVHRMIDINLKGTIFCTQAALESMKKRNEGYIVNVVSTAGKQGKVKESVYCASKFGARGFTESLAVELQDTGIQVSGIYMGGMKTEFWNEILTEEQTERLMSPEDVADVIVKNIHPRRYMTVEEVVIKNKKNM